MSARPFAVSDRSPDFGAAEVWRPDIPRTVSTTFVQALHTVADLLPRVSGARWLRLLFARSARRKPAGRRPDPFVDAIPEVSDQWLAEHSRRTGKSGDPL